MYESATLQAIAEEIRRRQDPDEVAMLRTKQVESIVDGLNPDDTGERTEAQKYNFAELDVSQTLSSEFASFIRKSGHHAPFVDVFGSEHFLQDLPLDSAELTIGKANLIVNRFSEHFLNEVSSGRAATCFENHINYALGFDDALNGVQYYLVKNLCRIVRRRPTPALFMAHYVLQFMEQPSSLKTILTASILNKTKNVERIATYGPDVLSLIEDREAAELNLLVVGFSQGQFRFVKSFFDEAKIHGRNVHIIIPDIDNGKIDGTKIQSIFENIGLDAEVNSVSDLSTKPVHLILSASRLVSWSSDGLLEVTTSDGASRFLNDWAERNQIADARPICVAVSGLFKFWPRFFKRHFEEAFAIKDCAEYMNHGSVLDRKFVDYLVTEHGVVGAKDLERSDFLKIVDSEPASRDVFFFRGGFKFFKIFCK